MPKKIGSVNSKPSTAIANLLNNSLFGNEMNFKVASEERSKILTDSIRGKELRGLNALYQDMDNEDIILNELSNQNTARMQQFNAEEAEKNRNWQTQMSNTSHQREVADLRAAGLNPVLSANSGATAYTSSPASSTIDSAISAIANKEMQ